jgi:hypothetical protein
MSETELEMITRRLGAIEDRLAITNLLAGAAMSADIASEPYWRAMYAEGAVMDRGAEQIDRGRDEILAIVRGPGQHAAADYGMSHLSSVPHITIDQDSAVATGYLLVVVPGPSTTTVALPGKGVSRELAIYHLTVNRWELRRSAEGWQVTRRVVRPIATDEARQMLRSGIEQDDSQIGASA